MTGSQNNREHGETGVYWREEHDTNKNQSILMIKIGLRSTGKGAGF